MTYRCGTCASENLWIQPHPEYRDAFLVSCGNGHPITPVPGQDFVTQALPELAQLQGAAREARREGAWISGRYSGAGGSDRDVFFIPQTIASRLFAALDELEAKP